MIVLYIFLILIGLALAFLATIAFFPLPRALPTESDLKNRSIRWKLYYANKYFKPMTRAQKDSGFEEHFRHRALKLMYQPSPEEKPLFTVASAGDLMARPDHTPPSRFWENLGSDFFSADVTTANFEMTVCPERPSHKTILFVMEEGHGDAVLDCAQGKVDYLSLGNNHMADGGLEAAKSTCAYLNKKGIAWSGVRPDKHTPLYAIQRVNGCTLAHLSFSFSSNGLAVEPHEYLPVVYFNGYKQNNYDNRLVLQTISEVKAQGVDVIVAHLHMGVEFEVYPQKRIRERAIELCEAGIDIIIANHPHIPQPLEIVQVGDRQGLIAYSLGNITNWAVFHPLQRMSTLLKFQVFRSGGKLRFGKIEVIPSFHLMRGRGRSRSHHLIDLRKNQQVATTLTKGELARVRRLRKLYYKHYHQEPLAPGLD